MNRTLARTACLVLVGCCLHGTARAQPGAIDVALASQGVLLGQVVDGQGHPLAAVPVTIAQAGRPLAVAPTDPQGYFAFRGVQGGMYELNAAQGSGSYRAWVGETAPPQAQRGVLIVAGQDLVRGQCRQGACPPGYAQCNPCAAPNWGPPGGPLMKAAIIGGIGAGIAIPVGIAISEANEDDEPATP
jgi:hypothetical protein